MSASLSKIDVVVIGAGQAGLSSAYHLQNLGLAPRTNYLILDKSPERFFEPSSSGSL